MYFSPMPFVLTDARRELGQKKGPAELGTLLGGHTIRSAKSKSSRADRAAELGTLLGGAHYLPVQNPDFILFIFWSNLKSRKNN